MAGRNFPRLSTVQILIYDSYNTVFLAIIKSVTCSTTILLDFLQSADSQDTVSLCSGVISNILSSLGPRIYDILLFVWYFLSQKFLHHLEGELMGICPKMMQHASRSINNSNAIIISYYSCYS